MNPSEYSTDIESISVCTRQFNKKCGYCKSGKEIYDTGRLSWEGLPIDTLYALYPYLLALLYDAKFNQQADSNRSLIIRCPNVPNPAFIRLSFRFKKLKLLLNILEKFARIIGFPKDAIDKIMLAEVVNENKDGRLPKGKKFILKIPDIRQLCPASFFSLYPFIYLCQRNKEALETAPLSLACPDPKSNISYLVDFSAGKSGGASVTKNLEPCCFYSVDLKNYKITALNNERCRMDCRRDQEITLDKIFPAGLCPTLFNAALPYIITFQNGGYFKWRKDIHTVEAQCPNSQSPVAFEIRRDPACSGSLSLVIKKTVGKCPHGHCEGQQFRLDFSRLICPHLFIRFFPYLLFLEYRPEKEKWEQGIFLDCPLQEGSRYQLKRQGYS